MQLGSSQNSLVLTTKSGRYAGLLCSRTAETLGRISNMGAQLQGYLDIERLKKHTKNQGAPRFDMMINVYGPRDAAIQIGDTLLNVNMFLQTPVRGAWDRSYAYSNPQSSSISGDMMEIDSATPDGIGPRNLHRRLTTSVLETQDYLHDILPTVSLEPVDEDLEASNYLQTTLMGHQKSALAIMQGIEKQTAEDHPSVGGILADQPGLGKSLTSLALVAADLPVKGHSKTGRFSRSTLLVAPLSMIDTWQQQLEEHLCPGLLELITYIGATQKSTLAKSSQPGIVLTSFETLVSDCSSSDSEMYSSKWHGIIVDEARFIKNRATKRFRALHALDAKIRWCLTGTPSKTGSRI